MSKDSIGASAAAADSDADLTAEQVAQYLERHPDFFVRRAALMAVLTPPSRWSDDSVVDFQKAMVETLREEMDGLRNCTQEVIETSRANMSLQTRAHQAVLAVVGADSLERLMRVIDDDLPRLLDVDVAAVGLEPGTGPVHHIALDIQPLEPGDVDRLLGGGQDTLLLSHVSDGGALFAGAAALVRSAAIVRIGSDDQAGDGIASRLPTGVLALGARHEGTFHPRQGTELLRFLGEVFEACLARLLAAQNRP